MYRLWLIFSIDEIFILLGVGGGLVVILSVISVLLGNWGDDGWGDFCGLYVDVFNIFVLMMVNFVVVRVDCFVVVVCCLCVLIWLVWCILSSIGGLIDGVV